MDTNTRHDDEVNSKAQRATRLASRLVRLYVGLTLYGISGALQVRANLGLDPWDVLHQGIAQRVHQQIGTVLIVVGVVVLLAWIPLRQRPGLGTISNVVLLGLAMNLSLDVLGPQSNTVVRISLLVFGILLCGVATGLYITAGFGPGPRDGLMTAIAARTKFSVRLVRTAIELIVLISGWLLGGSVGIGTVLFAVTIGPLSQLFLHLFTPNRAEPDLALTDAQTVVTQMMQAPRN